MVNYKDIRDYQTTTSFYGKTFTVSARVDDNGKARVTGITIEGDPNLEDPLDGATFDTAQAALDAGVRFACTEIGH